MRRQADREGIDISCRNRSGPTSLHVAMAYCPQMTSRPGMPGSEPVSTRLAVNADRLYDSLETLGRIGAYHDKTTGLDAVCRLALSDADRDARCLVVGWFEEAGL